MTTTYFIKRKLVRKILMKHYESGHVQGYRRVYVYIINIKGDDWVCCDCKLLLVGSHLLCLERLLRLPGVVQVGPALPLNEELLLALGRVARVIVTVRVAIILHLVYICLHSHSCPYTQSNTLSMHTHIYCYSYDNAIIQKQCNNQVFKNVCIAEHNQYEGDKDISKH